MPEELEASIKIKEEANNIVEQAKKQAEDIKKKFNQLKMEKIKSSIEVQESSRKAIQRLNQARKNENIEIKEIQDYGQKIFDSIEEKLKENIINVTKARELLKEKKQSSTINHNEDEEEKDLL